MRDPEQQLRDHEQRLRDLERVVALLALEVPTVYKRIGKTTIQAAADGKRFRLISSEDSEGFESVVLEIQHV